MTPDEVVGRVARVAADRSPFVKLDVQGFGAIAVCKSCLAAAPLAVVVADARALAHAEGCEVGEAIAQSRKLVEVRDVAPEMQ